MRQIILLICLLGWAGHAGFFLDNGMGLKGQQVAGAYTALATGVDAIYWNPARIGLSPGEVYLSYGQPFSEVTEYAILTTIKLTEDQSIGAGYYRVGVEDIPQYSVASVNVGRFQYMNDAIYLGYSGSLPMINGARIGVSVKSITQKAVSQLSCFAVDVGFSKELVTGVTMGLTLQDVASSRASESKPIYRFGLAATMSGVQLEADYVYYHLLSQGFPKVGLIYGGLPLVTLKGGYNGYDHNLYTGLSITIAELIFDYTFVNTEYGVTHRFGLGLEL